MGLLSVFQGGGKYFDKKIQPKCDYCQYGKRAKDGNKVLCEKRGLVDSSFSCGKFTYSPLKRIPVKQLNFVGSLADEELYSESKGDIAEIEEEKKASEQEKKDSEQENKASEQEKKDSEQQNQNAQTDSASESDDSAQEKTAEEASV